MSIPEHPHAPLVEADRASLVAPVVFIVGSLAISGFLVMWTFLEDLIPLAFVYDSFREMRDMTPEGVRTLPWDSIPTMSTAQGAAGTVLALIALGLAAGSTLRHRGGMQLLGLAATVIAAALLGWYARELVTAAFIG